MKLTLIILISILIVGCTHRIQHPVGSNYDYNGGFSQYTSYQLVSNDQHERTEQLAIEAGITTSMAALGYNLNHLQPSLYIYYQTYSEHFSQQYLEHPPLTHALARQGFFPEEDQSKVKKSKQDMVGSSLFISFYDPITQTEVWKGYITNFNPEKHNLRAAAQAVMNEYRVFAHSNQVEDTQWAFH